MQFLESICVYILYVKSYWYPPVVGCHSWDWVGVKLRLQTHATYLNLAVFKLCYRINNLLLLLQILVSLRSLFFFEGQPTRM